MRILLLTSLMILVACVAPQNTSDIKAAEPPPPMATTPANENAAPPNMDVASEKKADRKPGEVDFSCKTDSDCRIKNVGSCCGYRPACVNKDSETFPAQVKAQCEKEGNSSICGFPSISGCACSNNRCEGVPGKMVEGQLQ